ncbi:L,D-transpeptidase family protein [Flavihumibacter sp. R14]|nr:L,D-transpeptidase family protein [Flavihumibacter soli]
MEKALLLMNLVLIFAASCQQSATAPYLERDTTISKSNSFSEIFLDSLILEQFISNQHPDIKDATRLRNFYNSRNYQYAWFTKEGLAEQTLAFWNLQQNYITLSKDSMLADSSLSASLQAFVADDPTVTRPSREMTELNLTMHFFKYAEHAYAGRIDPEELQWHIPRKKVNEMVLLDSLIANKGQGLESWEPLNRQYNMMEKYLEQYNDLEMRRGTDSIVTPRKMIFREGDSSAVLIQIKKKLASLNDYNSSDTSAVYNPEFIPAVKQFQKRHGLKQQSIINATFMAVLNTPFKERIRQMLINMERFRWLPKEPPGKFILANIPEFRLRVFEGSRKTLDMDIIVGKAANKTIIFNDMLEYVVFSPYWNVPSSIVRNEILPAMEANRQYLRSKNMEITGYSGGLPVIRQRPGGSNSLGLVKFIFPNDYNIYFHDTPAKSLFREEYRAFSHGCIRLAEPEKLASYLLSDQAHWTPEKIKQAMQGSRENWVRLKTPIPVVITYFTAWVDKDGLLNFRNDVYGHDKRMAGLLFSKK